MFALTTIVLIDLFGIQLFGPIYGNIGFLRGLAAVAGPPFAGELSRSIFIQKITKFFRKKKSKRIKIILAVLSIC